MTNCRRRRKKYLPEYFVSDLDRLKKKASEVARHIVEEFVERPEIRTMDPAKQEPVMEKLQQDDPYIQFAYVVNAKGKKDHHEHHRYREQGEVRDRRTGR